MSTRLLPTRTSTCGGCAEHEQSARHPFGWRAVPHTDIVAATRNEDTLAIDVYRHAEETGRTITLGFVQRRD
jgi:hypothetical protein